MCRIYVETLLYVTINIHYGKPHIYHRINVMGNNALCKTYQRHLHRNILIIIRTYRVTIKEIDTFNVLSKRNY
jgi:hypothetical protein